MDFKTIAASITGLSCPVFGIGWQPPKLQRKTAQEVITFLEDRRVLWRGFMFEDESLCVRSVNEIRAEMTNHLKTHDRKTDVARFLRSIRSACRTFVSTVEDCNLRRPRTRSSAIIHQTVFFNALEKLRAATGKNLAYIAVCYGVDVEDELATIMPFNRLPAEQAASRRRPKGRA